MTRSNDEPPEDVSLVPLDDRRRREWLPASLEEYAQTLRAAGQPDEAVRSAVLATEELFADGAPPEHLLFSIRVGHDHVGVLWLAPGDPGDESGWWINDLMVLPPFRRRGFAQAALRIAMLEAGRRGAERLGLSVFAHNAAARRLYRASGFSETQVDMWVRLPRID